MNKLKELMKDNSFIRGSFFIIFNAILLCAMFFIIKNFGNITATLYHWLCVLLDALWPLIFGLILSYLLMHLLVH